MFWSVTLSLLEGLREVVKLFAPDAGILSAAGAGGDLRLHEQVPSGQLVF